MHIIPLIRKAPLIVLASVYLTSKHEKLVYSRIENTQEHGEAIEL